MKLILNFSFSVLTAALHKLWLIFLYDFVIRRVKLQHLDELADAEGRGGLWYVGRSRAGKNDTKPGKLHIFIFSRTGF